MPQTSNEAKNRADDEKFCESCGKAVNQMAAICPHCGVKQKSDGIAGFVRQQTAAIKSKIDSARAAIDDEMHMATPISAPHKVIAVLVALSAGWTGFTGLGSIIAGRQKAGIAMLGLPLLLGFLTAGCLVATFFSAIASIFVVGIPFLIVFGTCLTVLLPLFATTYIGFYIADVMICIKAPVGSSMKESFATLAETGKATADIVTKQAEKEKIARVLLPKAYKELGKEVYRSNQHREEFPQLYTKISDLRERIATLKKETPSSEEESVSQKAKMAATNLKNQANAKAMTLSMGHHLQQLGKSVFEGHGSESGSEEVIAEIEKHRKRIGELSGDIDLIEGEHAGQWLTPKRIIIAGACFIGLVILGALTSDSDTRSSQRGTNSPQPNTADSNGDYGLRDTFQLGDYQYQVTNVSTRSIIGGPYINERASDGAVFVVVSYSIENLTTESQTVASDDTELIDARGRTFTPSSAANTALLTEDGKDFILSELQPGLPRYMKTAFELPRTSLDGTLTLVVPEKGLFNSGEARVRIR